MKTINDLRPENKCNILESILRCSSSHEIKCPYDCKRPISFDDYLKLQFIQINYLPEHDLIISVSNTPDEGVYQLRMVISKDKIEKIFDLWSLKC